MWHTLSRSRRATIKRLSLLFIMLAGVGVAVDKVRAPARRAIALSAVPRITVSCARGTLRGAAGPRARRPRPRPARRHPEPLANILPRPRPRSPPSGPPRPSVRVPIPPHPSPAPPALTWNIDVPLPPTPNRSAPQFKKDATTHTEVLPWHQGGYEDHHGDIEEGMVPGGTFAGARMAAWETQDDDQDALSAEEDERPDPGGDRRDVRGGGGGGDGGGGDQYDGSYGEGVRADGIGNDDDAVERAAAGAGG